jgi:hypothetical protein
MCRALLLALAGWLLTVNIARPQEEKATPGTSPFMDSALTGWEGLVKEHWRYEDGVLVGTTYPKGLKFNTFLCSKKKYMDFELSFKVRLKDGVGNRGVQVRSKVADRKTFAVSGPQCDIGESYICRSGSGYRGDPFRYWLPGREPLLWPGDRASEQEKQAWRDRRAEQYRAARERPASA